MRWIPASFNSDLMRSGPIINLLMITHKLHQTDDFREVALKVMEGKVRTRKFNEDFFTFYA